MGYKLTFAYDNRGNLTDVVDRDNGTTHYVYDDDSRMTSVTNPFGETTGYVYSPGGRMETRLLANGCVTYYGYDEAGQVNLVDNRARDLSVISSFAYERDARGNPMRITREDGSVVEYGYDAKSQLTSEIHKDRLGTTTDAWEWNYDLCGNRTYQVCDEVRTDYTYNAANQLTQETTGEATTYYAYDRCGNTKSKQELAGKTSYRWDHENRLTQIDQPGNVHSYFSYDVDGKRVTKQDADGFTRFIYQGPDMLKLLQERDEEGNVTAHYTMGDGLESMHRGADSRFYHYDWLGSTFELTDGDGVVTDSYLYDGWGNALATTGTTPNPHRYVGRLRYYGMPGTGLYHVGHRQLDSATARFVSQDPLRHGRNWFGYVLCRPTRNVDPAGLQALPGPSIVLGQWQSGSLKQFQQPWQYGGTYDGTKDSTWGSVKSTPTEPWASGVETRKNEWRARGWNLAAELAEHFLPGSGDDATPAIPTGKTWELTQSNVSDMLSRCGYTACVQRARNRASSWVREQQDPEYQGDSSDWKAFWTVPAIWVCGGRDNQWTKVLGHFAYQFSGWFRKTCLVGDERRVQIEWGFGVHIWDKYDFDDMSHLSDDSNSVLRRAAQAQLHFSGAARFFKVEGWYQPIPGGHEPTQYKKAALTRCKARR